MTADFSSETLDQKEATNNFADVERFINPENPAKNTLQE